MHTVIRTYSGKGASEVMDFIIENKREVKKVMQSMKGFISLSLVKTEDGGFTVTVAKTERMAEAITLAAREWVVANTKHIKAKAPKVVGGKVLLTIAAAA